MLPNPHDRFFKTVFSTPAHAAAALRRLLPAETVATLELDTLHREPGTFVEPSLAERFTDLLFSVRGRGKQMLLYVLLEHQTRNKRVGRSEGAEMLCRSGRTQWSRAQAYLQYVAAEVGRQASYLGSFAVRAKGPDWVERGGASTARDTQQIRVRSRGFVQYAG